MRTIIMTLIAGLIMTSAAQADMRIEVNAQHRSKVSLDGRFVGLTPMVLDKVGPGTHELEVEHVSTRRSREFKISVPSREDVVRSYFVRFGGRTDIEERVVLRRSYEVSPVAMRRHLPARPAPRPMIREAIPTRRVVNHTPSIPVYHEPRPVVERVEAPSRDKVVRRNTILAAAAVNELVNNGQKRKDIREGAVAATLLNEIFTR